MKTDNRTQVIEARTRGYLRWALSGGTLLSILAVGLLTSQLALQASTRPSAYPSLVKSDNGSYGCLDAPLPSPWPAETWWLQQFPCNGGTNQHWRFEALGSWPYRYRIRYRENPTLCLDVPSGEATPGQGVQLYTCDETGSAENQLWTIVTFGDLTSEIKPVGDESLCIDVVDGIPDAAAAVQLFPCLSRPGQPAANQLWRFLTLGSERSWTCNGIVTLHGRGGQSTTVQPGEVVRSSGWEPQSLTCDDGTVLNWSCSIQPREIMHVLVDRRGSGPQFNFGCYIE